METGVATPLALWRLPCWSLWPTSSSTASNTRGPTNAALILGRSTASILQYAMPLGRPKTAAEKVDAIKVAAVHDCAQDAPYESTARRGNGVQPLALGSI